MKLQQDYTKLPEIFYTKQQPTATRESELILFNDALAIQLGLSPKECRNNPEWFTGSRVPEGAQPLAQAYSGHQFGHYTRLGDGRAVLLGELEVNGALFDVQLKGSGRTPYSRMGDGKAALLPMLREYMISEAMHALNIPTTRSLAVAKTGEPVIRERTLEGAVLTRIAISHLRVGTFQYALDAGGPETVRELADYAIRRHGIDVKDEDPLFSLFSYVRDRQAKLIAEWMRTGFIHGVMNTDNMTISGETIDYGPCAFLDTYHEQTVFSSIDRQGRYAYGNQPGIAKWNLARLGEVLLHAMEKPQEKLPEMEIALDVFDQKYEKARKTAFGAKIGIENPEQQDLELSDELLALMQKEKADFTNTFVRLTKGEAPEPAFAPWTEKWKRRLEEKKISQTQATDVMQKANPLLIPRNHLVEDVLQAAGRGDLAPYLAFLDRLRAPYDASVPVPERYTQPMTPAQQANYCTFCGT